ncbi:phosphatase PAP2 family protein [Candidatus Nardonella dryophthoridicola]|uniref:phosphatase PAP2 family protein n=1 Tax=Candidatus Nardonella dryophthoridicola TaxID=1971485 RepID=UPI003B97786A
MLLLFYYINILFKKKIKIKRPYKKYNNFKNIINLNNNKIINNFSFPSGHSFLCINLLLIFFYFFKINNNNIIYIIFNIISIYFRVLLGMHNIIDIIFGIILSKISFNLSKKIIKIIDL